MKRQIWKLAMVLAATTAIVACEDSKDDTASQAPATLKFNLTDAPVNYDAVYVEIEAVRVHIGDDDDTTSANGGWEDIDNIQPGIYNLLDFQNGLDTLFAEDEVPAGRLSQIRLILGDDNSVVVNGDSIALSTPSAQQSGLKLQVHYDLEPGLVYEFWLDFDASRSVVAKGNGGYNLKPVIKVFTKNTTGSIDGYIDPVDAEALVMAYNAAGDTATAYADTVSGYFLMSGLQPASYDITADPLAPYTQQSLSGVVVTQGAVTRTDTIKF